MDLQSIEEVIKDKLRYRQLHDALAITQEEKNKVSIDIQLIAYIICDLIALERQHRNIPVCRDTQGQQTAINRVLQQEYDRAAIFIKLVGIIRRPLDIWFKYKHLCLEYINTAIENDSGNKKAAFIRFFIQQDLLSCTQLLAEPVIHTDTDIQNLYLNRYFYVDFEQQLQAAYKKILQSTPLDSESNQRDGIALDKPHSLNHTDYLQEAAHACLT
jgi:hypothetical protein